jgi:hypothetical protein
METLGVVEVEKPLDERINQSHQTKRPSYHSPLHSRRAERTKIGTSSRPNEFSKAETIILRGAAEILDISLEQLHEVTGTSRSVSRNGTSFESDSASSSCSEVSDGAQPATTPFALKPAHIWQRARQNSRLHKSTIQHLSVLEDGDGANNTVIPRVSGLTDYKGPEFWNNFLPTGTYEEDSTAYVNNIGTGIEQDGWFHLSPVPREAPDYSHVEQPDLSDTTPFANPPVLQLPWFESRHPNPDSPITISYQSKASGLQPPSMQDTVSYQSNASGLQPPSMQNTVRRRPKERMTTIKGSAKSSTKRKHRGHFLDSEQKKETGLTRRLGACIRCRMQRIRVSYVLSCTMH